MSPDESRDVVARLMKIYNELIKDETPAATYIRRQVVRGAFAGLLNLQHPDAAYEHIEAYCSRELNPGI